MPSYSITAPNGRVYRMSGPAGLTEDDVIEHVMKFDPEAGKAPPPPKGGFMPALQSGLENLYTSGRAAFKGATGDTEAAAAEAAAAEKEQAQKYDPQVGLARVGEAYDKSGLIGAGKEVMGQVPRFIAQSAPQMGATIAGAKLGATVGRALGPLGGLIGGGLGGLAANVPTFIGQNLAEQSRENPNDISYGKAATAAVGQSALEEVTPALFLGSRVASKIFGADVAKLMARVGPEAAEEVAKRSLLSTLARGGAHAVLAEGGTEVGQEVLSRLQAGEPLLNDDALRSYAENFYGGALAGGPLGAAGHVYDRMGAKQEVAAKEAEQAAVTDRATAEQAAAAAAAKAQQRTDPAYAAKVAADYAEYEKTKAEMIARGATYKAEGTDAGTAAYKDMRKQTTDFIMANKGLIDDYNAVARPVIEAEKARQAAAAAAAAAQPGEPPSGRPDFALGVSTPDPQQRIAELQAQIADHETSLDEARNQMMDVMRTGKSSAIGQARTELGRREKLYHDTRAELERVAPGTQARQIAEQAAAEERANFDPEKAQKQIDALTAKLAGVTDPDEAKKAEGWAKQREKLQGMIDEQRKAPAVEPAPIYNEDLFGLGQRLRTEEKLSGQRQLGQERGLQALGAGEATQVWPNLDPRAHEPPGTAYGDTPEAHAAETDAAFNRAFASKTRSGMLDVLAKSGDEDARFVQVAMSSPIRGAGGAVVEHLASLPASDRKEVARSLQDFSKGVVADLYAGLQAARKVNDRAKTEDFIDAIRSIAASQEATKGRAHYTSDFYNTAARLIPGVMQGAYEAAGMSAPQATAEQRGRAVAGQQFQVLTDLEKRLAGTADPRITRAMEQVAAEGEDTAEPVTPPPREDVTGQGMLFQPQAGPEVAPVDAMRQRIASVLARPGLTGQARTTLKHAADALDRPDVPQRVLEHVGATVAAAERGIGGGATVAQVAGEGKVAAHEPPTKVGSLAEIGKLTEPATRAGVKGTLHVVGAKPGMKTHAAAVAGHLVPETPKIKPQRLEMEKVGEAGPNADVQPDMFDQTYVGRQTPGGFQRALDTGALPSKRGAEAAARPVKELLRVGKLLAQRAKWLQSRINDADAAKARLDALGPRLKEGTPNQKQMASVLQRNMMQATLAAEDASAAARTLTKQANEAEAANEGAGADLRDRAQQAGRTARRHSDRVDAFKREIKTLTELDAAPALAETAKHRDALAKELAGIEKEQTANAADLKKAQGSVQAKQRKAAKAAPVEALPTEAPEKRLLQRQPAPIRARVPTEAEKIATVRGASAADYAARTGERVLQVQAKMTEAGIEANADAVTEAIETALAVPGVTGADLKTAISQVQNYRTERAFVSEGNKIRKRLGAVQTEMNQLRKDNRGGVLTPALEARRAAALDAVAKLEPQIKATKSADERAKLMDRLDNAESRLKEFDTKRTPLENDPHYKELAARAAVLSFKSDVIDMQQQARAYEEAQVHKTASAEAKTARAARRQKGVSRGVVEPAVKLSGDVMTKTQAAQARKPQGTLYSSKNPGPTPTMVEAQREHRAKAAGEDAAIAARHAVDLARSQRGADAATNAEVAGWEGEGGRVNKLVAEMFDPNTHTPLSDQNMVHLYDGQLDKVLDSLAKTGSTPFVRELAAKLQVLAKDTKVMLGEPHDKQAVADYDSKTNTITIHPLGLTEENLLHEVGHAATLRTMIMPASQLTQSQINARAGLQSLLTQIQKDPAFNREYGRTNLAELASEVLSNKNLRDKIDAQKPGFIRRFINAVLQMLGVRVQTGSEKAMAQVERLFQPAREFTKEEVGVLHDMLGATRAPSVARAAANPLEAFASMVGHTPTKQGVMSTIKDANAGLAAEMALVDQRAPILKALSKGAQQGYMQAMYYIRKADARMSQVYGVLQRGPLGLKKDAKGNHIIEAGNGPGAKAIFEAIGKLPGKDTTQQFALAQAYMVAQRAQNKGWHTLGWPTTDQQRAAGEAALAYANANPALKAKLDTVRTMYNDYNKGMVQFLGDTGAIPKALAAKLLKDGDYVPFYRVGGEGVAELVMGENTHIRIGDIRKQKYLQELKSDTGKLLPLNEAIIRNTMLLTTKGLENLATKEIAYGLQGMSPDVNQIRSGRAPSGPDVIKFNQEPAPGDSSDTGERWMRVTSEGTPFAGIPAEMLVQSLEGVHTVVTGVGKLAASFGHTLRKGVTLTPMYVIRQLIRDPMSASFTAGASRGPVRAMFKSMKEFVDQSLGSTATGEALLRKGVTQSGLFSDAGNASDLATFAHQLASGNQSALTKLVAVAERAAMRADAVTRAQVYEDAMKKTGSEMHAELMAMEMMNFTKRGSSPTVQHAARMIPFLNAQMQSLNVLAKAFRGNMPLNEQMEIRSKFIKNAIGLTLFSMAYAMGMEDNEEYKNATAQDRLSNFFVPTPWGTFKVPIPYEIGLLFKALPEVLMHGMDASEVKALGGMALNSIPGASNYGIPQMGKPLLEHMLNKDLYTGRDIENAEQLKLDPAMRYGPNTTELAKVLSSMLPSELGLSPLKIEHLVRGYLGGLPIAAASLANEVLSDTPQPERHAAQTPLLGGLIADPLAAGAVERAYAKANAIAEAGATYDKLVKEGRVKDAKDYMQDNLNVLQADVLNKRFREAMARAKREREGTLSMNLSSDQKRERLDAILRWRNEQAALFTKAAESIVAAR